MTAEEENEIAKEITWTTNMQVKYKKTCGKYLRYILMWFPLICWFVSLGFYMMHRHNIGFRANFVTYGVFPLIGILLICKFIKAVRLFNTFFKANFISYRMALLNALAPYVINLIVGIIFSQRGWSDAWAYMLPPIFLSYYFVWREIRFLWADYYWIKNLGHITFPNEKVNKEYFSKLDDIQEAFEKIENETIKENVLKIIEGD